MVWTEGETNQQTRPDVELLHNNIKRRDNVMQHCELTVIASVQPGQPWTQDRLEGKLPNNLMSMDYNGGMNIRDETKRRRNNGR